MAEDDGPEDDGPKQASLALGRLAVQGYIKFGRVLGTNTIKLTRRGQAALDLYPGEAT